MKKLFLFLILAVVSVTMEAQAQSANRLVVHKGDQTVVGYTLNAVDISIVSAIPSDTAILISLFFIVSPSCFSLLTEA